MADTGGVTATPEDHSLAVDVARQAGALLLEIRAECQREGVEGKDMKDRGDIGAHDLIMELLGAARPDDAILSEEGADDKARLAASRVWIVDPLDGTREFSEPPRSDWAVHIALAIDGEPVAGAVALPGLDGEVLSTLLPPVVPPSTGSGPRVVVSRTRRPPAAVQLADKLPGAQYLEMGSAGAKAMAVVRGECDIYAHSGGQYEWDNCAPVAVALAAGLHCSRLDGSPMVYNNDDVYLPDLLICRPEWAQPCLDILASSPEGS